jgi:DNA-binding MarR family transcriptional regulator
MLRAARKRADDDGSTLELARALYALASAVARSMPRDMSPTSVATLVTLGRFGPLRLTRLAAYQRVAQPSMTVVVSRLEAEGLVERRPDESDGRAVLVALTERGQSYLGRRREARAASLAASISGLPPQDLAALRRALPAIAHLAAIEEPGPPETGLGESEPFALAAKAQRQ